MKKDDLHKASRSSKAKRDAKGRSDASRARKGSKDDAEADDDDERDAAAQRRSARRAREAKSVAAKGVALKVTAGLCVLLVLLVVLRLSGAFTPTPPARTVIDYEKKLQDADDLARQAGQRFSQARGLKESDPQAALRALNEGFELQGQARALFEEILQAPEHAGEGFERVSAKLERMNVETMTYRKLKMELQR